MIEASYDTLLRQASMTAHDYLLRAVRDIDEILGDGYAKKHPELIAAFIKVAAMDFGAMTLAKEINEGLNTLARSVEELAGAA